MEDGPDILEERPRVTKRLSLHAAAGCQSGQRAIIYESIRSQAVKACQNGPFFTDGDVFVKRTEFIEYLSSTKHQRGHRFGMW